MQDHPSVRPAPEYLEPPAAVRQENSMTHIVVMSQTAQTGQAGYAVISRAFALTPWPEVRLQERALAWNVNLLMRLSPVRNRDYDLSLR